ncbi:MAG: DUF374 domain-containing protein [Planctomycetota bacterium]
MKIQPPGLLVHLFALGWTSTWKIERRCTENLEAARRIDPRGTLVGVFWHQHLLLAAAAHHHQHVAAIASQHGDGELIAAHLERVGIRTVRGSSTRGGVSAARGLSRAVEEGWMLALAPDGPRGPAHVIKPGAIEIAHRNHIPLLPFGFAASRAWEFSRSWDRFCLPWPGTRIAVVYGEPVLYPAGDIDRAEVTRRCEDMAKRISAAETAARRVLNVAPS